MTIIFTEVALRDDDSRECFRVFVTMLESGRQLTTPQFQSIGAARAYAKLIESGYRKPEFRETR